MPFLSVVVIVLISLAGVKIGTWVPSIVPTACGILQFTSALNFRMASAFSRGITGKLIHSYDRLFNYLQKSLQIVTAVDLPTAKTFAILLNVFPIYSLQIAMATRFSTAIALWNWVSLFITAGETNRSNFWKLSPDILKSALGLIAIIIPVFSHHFKPSSLPSSCQIQRSCHNVSDKMLALPNMIWDWRYLLMKNLFCFSKNFFSP